MNREEFMQEARETAHRILEGKENGIMNLVQQAWAEGKRNAEVDTMTELMKQAFDQVKQKDAVAVKATDKWISVNDMFPEDETIVLALVCYKVGWYRMLAWHDKHGWHSNADEFDERIDSNYVTHWTPLPDLPKGEA